MDKIKQIVKESINNLILEVQMPEADEITTSGLPVLYRVGFKNQVDSIFKNGYNRQFAGMAGGLMYGIGTYCNNNLKDAQASVGVKEYGDTIFKMYLAGGYYGFIIFNESIAKSVYGQNYQVFDQLKTVYNATPKEIQEIKHSCESYIRKKGGTYLHGRTGPAANGFADCTKFIQTHNVKGVIYKGLRDGLCVVPYDFGAIIPYSVSYDRGKTFVKRFRKDEYEERIKNNVDVNFHYGNKYKQVFEPRFGFAMVENSQGKFNFVNINTDKELSLTWFDMITRPLDKATSSFGFQYKGLNLDGSVKNLPGNTENGCVLDEDGNPYCNFSELDDLVQAIAQQSAVSESRIINEMIEEDYGQYPIPDEDEIHSGSMTAIYRATPSEHLESIFRNGFNRQFAGSHVGSAYGEGTYCMETFDEALRNVSHGYGDTVVKMYVIGGFDHFLIYHESLAKRVYGNNYNVYDQLKNIFKIPRHILNTISYSSPSAMGHNQSVIKKYGIRGLIYRWGPGYAVNVCDFSTIIPYSVFFPLKKKWKTMFNYDDFNRRMNDNVDVNFRYGEKYKAVFEGKCGFVLVKNDEDKYNFVDIQDDKELSPFWFDMVTKPINPDTKQFGFIYKGISLTGCVENIPGSSEKGCVLDEDGNPYCDFKDLENLYQYMKSEGLIS